MDATDPRLNHPNAPGRGPVADCRDCAGAGCLHCGGSGLVPAWLYDPQIVGEQV